RKVGVDIEVLEIRRAADIAPAFQALKAGAQALYVCGDALVNATHARINTLALGARLPAFHASRDYLGAGGFMFMGQTRWTCSGARAALATRSSRGRCPLPFRSSSRPSPSWFSICPPRRRLASRSPSRSCCAPTR